MNNHVMLIGKIHNDIEKIEENDQVTYQLVGKQEANLTQNKISFASPIGKALENHQVGDTVSVSAPEGSYDVKIIKISLE